MKKFLCLILSLCMLSCIAFATGNVSFDKPDSATLAKIEKAIKIDGHRLHKELYGSTSSSDYVITDNSSLKNIGSYNGNYILIYGNEDITYEMTLYKAFGDHYFRFNGTPYAVYSTEEDKLISVEEAYNSGMFPKEIIDEINNHYIELQNSTGSFFEFGSIIGDANTDGIINILDLVIVRSKIVNNNYPKILETCMVDMNKDDVINIVDVVMMRDIIVNG